MDRFDFDEEAARDRVIGDITQRLVQAELDRADPEEELCMDWLYNECEVEAIKQVERMEQNRAESRDDNRIARFEFDRAIS